jgi:hypothetical protein
MPLPASYQAHSLVGMCVAFTRERQGNKARNTATAKRQTTAPTSKKHPALPGISAMDRSTPKRFTEYALLLAAVLTGGLATTFMPSEQRGAATIPTDQASINQASTEIPALGTLGFEVDSRRLNEIAAMC